MKRFSAGDQQVRERTMIYGIRRIIEEEGNIEQMNKEFRMMKWIKEEAGHLRVQSRFRSYPGI
jgi:predicted MarR family transcription regulator